MAVVIDILPSSYIVGHAGDQVPEKVIKEENEPDIGVFKRIFFLILKVDIKGKSVLLCNSLDTPEEDTEKLKQMLFEDFDVRSLYVANQSVLSLYATGHQEGLVIRSSETQTIIAPVVDGYVVKSDVMILNMGNQDLLKSLEDAKGIHHHIYDVLEKSSKKSLLYKTIVLAGGPYDPDLREKLQRALAQLANCTVKVIDYVQPEYQAFIGGSLLASLPEFKDILIKQSDFEPKVAAPRLDNKSKPVVIDLASRNVHVGYAGDRKPLHSFQTGNAENVFRNIFNELKVGAGKTQVLVSVSVATPAKERDDIVKILFEKFGISSLYIANQSALSLFATGHKEGLVIDSTESRTCIAPIIDGFVVKSDVNVTNVGRDGLLNSLNDDDGIHQRVNNVIQTSSKKEMLIQTIILASGAVGCGFGENLQKEMSKFHNNVDVLDAFAQPEYQAWIGGSILASLPDFQNMLVSKVNYKEKGIRVVHEKCK